MCFIRQNNPAFGVDLAQDHDVQSVTIINRNDQRKFMRLCFNTLRPRQNGRHFANDVFKCIFLNENVLISLRISLKFVPKGLINNIPPLVQIMAWRRPGDKPLSEPMMVNLLTHICVTQPQWVNSKQIPRQNCPQFADAIFKLVSLKQRCILILILLAFASSSLICYKPSMIWILACRRPCDKPYSYPMMS